MVGIGVGVGSTGGVGGAAALSAVAVGGASAAAACEEEEEVFILQSCDPAVTFSPSGTNCSSMTPDTGEGTGIAVYALEYSITLCEYSKMCVIVLIVCCVLYRISQDGGVVKFRKEYPTTSKLLCSTYSQIKGYCSLKALKFKLLKYTGENTGMSVKFPHL